MQFVRTFVAVLIVFSVAALPAAGEPSVAPKAMELSTASADMPCCPCCDAHNDLKGSIACALKCITLFGAVLPPMVSLQHIVDAVPPSFVDGAWHGHITSPPTHPPPV
jgi:hypothetical protein